MEYSLLTTEEQHNGLVNRIHQLEQEHYSNIIYIEECDIVGDQQSREQLVAKNVALELRIDGLRRKAIALETTESEDDPAED